MKRMLLAAATLLCLLPYRNFVFAADGSATPKAGEKVPAAATPDPSSRFTSTEQEIKVKLSNIDDLYKYSRRSEGVGEQYEMAIDKICDRAGSNGGEVKDEMNRLRPRDYYKTHEQTPFVDFTKIVKWRKVAPMEYFYGTIVCGSEGFLNYLSSIGVMLQLELENPWP